MPTSCCLATPACCPQQQHVTNSWHSSTTAHLRRRAPASAQSCTKSRRRCMCWGRRHRRCHCCRWPREWALCMGCCPRFHWCTPDLRSTGKFEFYTSGWTGELLPATCQHQGVPLTGPAATILAHRTLLRDSTALPGPLTALAGHHDLVLAVGPSIHACEVGAVALRGADDLCERQLEWGRSGKRQAFWASQWG